MEVKFNGQFTFARISASAGDKALTISFKIESDDAELEQLHDIYLSISCDWDRDKAEEMDSDKDGSIDIATLPNDTTVVVEELKPAPPQKTTLTKSAASTAAGLTTWTVQCAVGNEDGKVPTELVDSLPKELDYVTDSAAVTVTPQDGSASPAYSIYDDVTHRLIYVLPATAKEVTLEYQTKPSSAVITKFWQDGKTPSFENMAQAQNDSVVCAEAKYRVSYNGLKPLVKKQYLDLDYEETSGTYFATWGIEVDSQGQTLELLTLHDTYGTALLLPQAADGTVDFDQMDMQIVYADPGGVPDPTIPIEEKDVHMDANNRTIDIDLAPYFAQMAGLPKQSFRVTYKLQVDKSALEQGSTPESFRNQVFGEFKTTEMTDLANSAISTAELPVKTENTLILQTGGQYNSATRALPWTTTINPGLQSGVVSPNLTSVVYEDRFTKGSSSSEFFGYEYQSFGLTEAAIQAQRDSIEQQIKAQFQEKGLTAATVNVSITETDTERVLRVELTNTGTASIQFRYSTYVLKPEHWASNLSNRTFRNQVSLLSAGTTINGVAITKDATASARVTVSGTVLQKWPRDSYDTTNNQLDWGIEVNRRLSPLGKIQVVDVLPEGVTYIPGTARLKNGPAIPDNVADENGNYVSQNGQTLTFYLNLEKPERIEIIYTTSVDTNSPQFTQTTHAKLNNQAKLSIWSEADKAWLETAKAQQTAHILYSVLNKTVIQSNDQEDGVRKANYTVQINPLRMELQEPGADQVMLVDTLADGLLLDLDSVQLYAGVTPVAPKPSGGMVHEYRPTINPGARITADIQYDTVQNQLKIVLPESNQPYYLTYTAYLTRAGVDLSNRVQLVNTCMDDSMVQAEKTVKYNIISGGASLRPPANRYCSLLLKKVSSDSSATPLEGAEFGLYSAESEDALLAIGVSGADGVCTLSVQKSQIAGLQQLFYKELKAPPEHLVGNNGQWHAVSMEEVTASAANPIVVPNEAATDGKTGRLRILRQDEYTQEPLAGAVFTVYEGDTEVASGTTNLRGIVEFDGLDPAKSYRIVETTPPAGYPPTAEKLVQAAVEPKETILENGLKPLDCTILKTGAQTGAPLAGAKFGLYDTADCSGTPITTTETDNEGKCTFAKLDASRQYWVREIAPPEHYAPSDTIYQLDFSKGENIDLSIKNTRKPVTLEIIKQDEKQQPLANAEFELTEDREQLDVVGTGITGTDGRLRFDNLLPNHTYYLWETKAPEGYQCPTEPVVFTTDLQSGGDQVQLTVQNKLTPITLTVQKVDDISKEPLPGAVFRLTTDPEGLTEQAVVSCDENGVAVFYDLLPDCTYYLWETTAPAGYVCPQGYIREIHTTKQQSALHETIENSQLRTSLTVHKVDAETNAPLSGAELVLSRDEAGTDIIRSLETDAAGTVQFEDLLPGHTYYVTERRAPAGYEKTDQVFPVTIPTVSSGGTPEPVQLSVPNQRSRDDSGSGGGGSGGGGNVTPLQYTLTYDLRYDSKTERETYPAGTHVRLNRTPFRDGYFFTGWYREAACINRISEVYLTGNQTVYAGWERYAVSDLLNAEDHFAYIIGYPDGKVHPEDNVTRGEVATIFFRLLDPEVREDNLTQDTAFTDVPADRWYRTAIATMESMGIVNGRTPTEFAPDAPITRAEFAAIASRFHLGELTPDAAFTDIAGHWAEDEICRGATLGWIRGYEDGSFRPEQYITRAETMTLVNRMLLRLPETPADLLSNMIRWPDNADSQVWYYLAVQEATNSHDHFRKPDGVYETWTALNPVEDWTKYER